MVDESSPKAKDNLNRDAKRAKNTVVSCELCINTVQRDYCQPQCSLG